MSRFLMQPATQAVSRFIAGQAALSKFVARHPVAAKRFQFVVSRVPIVSKFLTFLVPTALTPPRPVEIKQAADAITTPPLRPRFNRPSGPRF